MAVAQNKKKQSKGTSIVMLIVSIALVFLVVVTFSDLLKKESSLYNYEANIAEISNEIESGKVKIDSVTYKPIEGSDNKGSWYISGKFVEGSQKCVVNEESAETCYKTFKVMAGTNYQLESFLEVLNANGVNSVRLETISSTNWLMIIIQVLPFVILIVFLVSMMKQGGAGSKSMEFGKSRAKLARSKTVKFKDVAGNDEEKQEMEEIIDFLKNPLKYKELGARIPKGVLLSGPPGTGKTLLAKAVAGEANVPFFSISGSDFLEMFVGVGASRVRDMFKTARQSAPCIIFIDEIDAIGRQRGAGLGGGHDEREQTLNQLLTEMDGFETHAGIIIIAATNRPDVLDPALLRPGRFDRQIIINTPDVRGREAILKVHARNKKLSEGLKLADIARRTPGFSGADLENLLNEAALLTARDNRKVITIQDIDEAVDRVLMGPAKKSKKFTEKERNLVAHHEAGHAVIGIKLDNAEVVQKVTIIPRGTAGGYALMLPEEERFLETKQSLLDRITGILGGRVAEEVMFNEVSTGAHNDFQKATKIARAMVTEYGMSSLGPISYEESTGSVFLGRDYQKNKNFSDQVALEIDKEVRNIIEECYAKAKRVIQDNLPLLKQIAHYLLEIETLNKEDIYEIVETGKVSWWEKKKIEDANKPAEVKEEIKIADEVEETSVINEEIKDIENKKDEE